MLGLQHLELQGHRQLILITAAERSDHRIERFPDGVKGDARAKVLGSLEGKGLSQSLRDGREP
ncbi:MAG: hypothetical protein H6R26_1172 [Proteobacteria bacterium]|nr:hypothetical protein [Pseudomonadota bacterium]